MTSDDGTERDREFVAALRSVSCPATLFVSLGLMSDASRRVYAAFVGASDVRIEDHSLGHRRAFHYRQVVGFHCDGAPLVNSPERLGLQLGSPVCLNGPELHRPRFQPSAEAVAASEDAAQRSSEIPGTPEWTNAIAEALMTSGEGFQRLGRLCIRGRYDTRAEFRTRVSYYLAEGRTRLQEFTGKAPVAFAYPWWQGNRVAARSLRELGYRLTFSGLGLCHTRSTFEVPRLFINNDTPRPLVPEMLARAAKAPKRMDGLRDVARRLALA